MAKLSRWQWREAVQRSRRRASWARLRLRANLAELQAIAECVGGWGQVVRRLPRGVWRLIRRETWGQP